MFMALEWHCSRTDGSGDDSLDWFPERVWEEYEKDELAAMALACGIEEKDKEKAERISKLALWCVQDSPEARPPMSDVVKMLEGVVEFNPPPKPFQYLSSVGMVQTQPIETTHGSSHTTGTEGTQSRRLEFYFSCTSISMKNYYPPPWYTTTNIPSVPSATASATTLIIIYVVSSFVVFATIIVIVIVIYYKCAKTASKIIVQDFRPVAFTPPSFRLPPITPPPPPPSKNKPIRRPTETVRVRGATATSMEKFLQEIEAAKPVRFTAEQLKKFTDDYKTGLGAGGFGEVYKGQFPDGVRIAVKVLRKSLDKRDEEQFMAEMGSIGRTYHINLIRLYGFCHDRNMNAIVYEAAALNPVLESTSDGSSIGTSEESQSRWYKEYTTPIMAKYEIEIATSR
ncbi:hypothetical protein Patl1_12697 [Pistacia atlantica]|uniref:Uncharacterized protein n=1 Tax=Pistacia atlantica TaxID=434234 RepID=A0ACC1ASV5_9ROSI|nr:hypothetical protein Patl1_12697 [Pistacia atlantica]